eukprot:12472190-Ditylum_brightwellii.AAC.1
MPVSKNVFLWLRGGGLKDDRDSIDNDQKDNDDKIMGPQTIKVLVRECLLVLQQCSNFLTLPFTPFTGVVPVNCP